MFALHQSKCFFFYNTLVLHNNKQYSSWFHCIQFSLPSYFDIHCQEVSVLCSAVDVPFFFRRRVTFLSWIPKWFTFIMNSLNAYRSAKWALVSVYALLPKLSLKKLKLSSLVGAWQNPHQFLHKMANKPLYLSPTCFTKKLPERRCWLSLHVKLEEFSQKYNKKYCSTTWPWKTH